MHAQDIGQRGRDLAHIDFAQIAVLGDPGASQAVCHMMDLSVDRVYEAARVLLAETEPKAASTS